jgi:hypothetical protein
VFPNPVKEALTVTLADAPGGTVKLVLYDPYGAPLKEAEQTLQTGQQNVTLSLPPGMSKPGFYYLSVQTAAGSRIIRLLKE